MILGEFQEALRDRGWQEEAVDELTFRLMQKFPGLYDDPELMPMSAGMWTPDVPEDVARYYLSGRGTIRVNIVAAGLTKSELRKLRAQVFRLSGIPRTDKKFAAKLDKVIGTGRVLSISKDNSKLGKMQNFSLPVGQPERGGSCVGASEICESVCYLTEGFVKDPKTGRMVPKGFLYKMQQVPYYLNWALVTLFPQKWMRAMIKEIKDEVFRIHVGGDYFAPEYIGYWTAIAQAKPDIRFFAYTRVWNDGIGNVRPEMLEPLAAFAAEENCRLLLSCDRDTGVPEAGLVPGTIRAWMAVEDDEPEEPVELIFRDKGHLKRRIMAALKFRRDSEDPKRTAAQQRASEEKLASLKTELAPFVRGRFEVDGVQVPVCPIEINPLYIKNSGDMNCNRCGWCFSFLHAAHRARREDELAEMSEYTGKNAELTIQSLARVGGIAANPFSHRYVDEGEQLAELLGDDYDIIMEGW